MRFRRMELVQCGEFLWVQTKDKFCRERVRLESDQQSCYEYDPCSTLVQKSKLDGALKVLVPERPFHQSTTPRLLFSTVGSSGRDSDVLHPTEEVLQGPDM